MSRSKRRRAAESAPAMPTASPHPPRRAPIAWALAVLAVIVAAVAAWLTMRTPAPRDAGLAAAPAASSPATTTARPAYVDTRLKNLAQSEDLARYVL